MELNPPAGGVSAESLAANTWADHCDDISHWKIGGPGRLDAAVPVGSGGWIMRRTDAGVASRTKADTTDSMLCHSPFATAQIDKGMVTAANDRFLWLFGLSVEDPANVSIETLLPEWRQLLAGLTSGGAASAVNELLQWTCMCPRGRPAQQCLAHLSMDVSDESMLLTVIDAPEDLDTSNMFREIIDKTSAVVYLKDLAGRYQFVNRQFEELFGVQRQSAVGLTDFDLFPDAMARDFRLNDEQVAMSGLPSNTEEVAPHPDGLHTYMSVKFPLRGPNDCVVAVAGISTDITELERANRETRRLRDELQLVLDSVKDGLIGVDCRGAITFANRAAGGILREPAARLLGGRLTSSFGSQGFSDALQSVLTGAANGTASVDRVSQGLNLPLPVEYTIAALADTGQATRAVVTFRDLSERMARERVEHELLAAHAVQKSLYPHEAPLCPGWDVAGAAFPAALACGDYYDFLCLPGNRLALVIGDVSGHGLGSAVSMVETRAYLRSLLLSGVKLPEAIECLNEFLVVDLPEASFVTLFVAVVDLESRELTYVGAGHPGYCLRADGSRATLPSTATVLGFSTRLTFPESAPLKLSSGDVLVLPTDGIQECLSEDGEFFGVDRLLGLVQADRHRPSAELAISVYQACQQFVGARPQQDDISLVVARVLDQS